MSDLFLVYLEAPQTPLDPDEFAEARRLTERLFLIRSSETRSRVYHAVKHATRPDALLVTRCDGDPKFKGMEAGALKWLRALD